jgi:hypothetical protein
MSKERITISVEMMLIERVQAEADAQKRSLSNMIAVILQEWLDSKRQEAA